MTNLNLFDGATLFKLKATHGLPLDFAIAEIFEAGLRVEWPSFIEEARRNGWDDLQTYDAVDYALQDSGIPKETQEEIKLGFRIYMLKYRQYKEAHA